MPKQIDYTNEESMLAVSVGHMWRTSSGIDLEGQIKIRECRVAKFKRLKAPEIILNHEVRQLNTLLRRKERELI